MAMERHKATRKKFGDHLAAVQARNNVACSVFKNEYSLQRSVLRQSKMGFSMPRRSEHEDPARNSGHSHLFLIRPHQRQGVIVKVIRPRMQPYRALKIEKRFGEFPYFGTPLGVSTLCNQT